MIEEWKREMRELIASKHGSLICDTCGLEAIDYDDEAIQFVCASHREINILKRRIDRLQAKIDAKLLRRY